MGLSNDLISQFVKATNDNTKTKSEKTVYGTTVIKNGTTYVKLDGSDQLTPILATADTKPGERVMVMIKNHLATIIGNLSSPAARVDDIKDYALTVQKVDELQNDNTQIKEALNNAKQNISDNKEKIEKLKLEMLTTGDADIKYTKKEEFDEFKNSASESIKANEEAIKKLQNDFNGNVLWDGSSYGENEEHISLLETIDKQKNGIVLVFSEYINEAASDTCISCHFIPKKIVSIKNGSEFSFTMTTSDCSYISTICLRINNDNIVGVSNKSIFINKSSEETSINNSFVLRYIIGV